MPSLGFALRAIAMYFLVIGAATIIGFVLVDQARTTLEMLWRLLPLQILLVGFCVFIVHRYSRWSDVGFGRIRWVALLWLSPSILLMGLMLNDVAPHVGSEMLGQIGMLGLSGLLLVPLLIGFSEEVMFRGILLRGAMNRMPTSIAMVLSAMLFALLHAISGVLVQTLWPTVEQLAFAFCVGLFLAPVALRIGSLWPLIFWHAAWDLIILTSQIVQVEHPLALAGMLFQLAWCVPLWTKAVRMQRHG